MTFEFVKPKSVIKKEKEVAEKPQKELQENKISVKEKMSRTTGRFFEFYKRFLNINPTELDGKKILNVGAGRSDIGNELKEQNIEPELLINLDLAYKEVGSGEGLFKKIVGKNLKKNDIPDNAIAGDMKNLPFSNSTFDQIVCLWSVAWLKQKDKVQALSELFRTCKDEGEVSIYPVSYSEKAREIIDKYPFLEVFKPDLDEGRIVDTKGEDVGAWKKIKSFLSDFDNSLIEATHKIREGLKGKQVGTLIIKKNVDEDIFNKVVRELEDEGFIM